MTISGNGDFDIKWLEEYLAKKVELEEKIKYNIDRGITIWCEPVGDKSALRKLRGVKIKS